MKIWILLTAAVLAGCNGCREPKHAEMNYDQIQDQLIQSNRAKLQEENLLINRFVAEKGWPMTQTNTGLRYWIYENGKGRAAENGKYAEITYVVTLLDGTECYRSEEGESARFLIGQDNVESGLHEGILYLHEGDHARFIIPSHLAYGLTGDSGKIPQDATVVYDLQLVSLK